MVLLIAFATFIATLIGGFLALKFRDKLHLVLGFSAGAVIGVAFFDLLPEAIELGESFFEPSFITSLVAVGFVAYMLLDRAISFALPHEEEHAGHAHHHRGTLGAASLSIHSFLDGMAVGLAFQVSAAVGAVVTLAVLAHDFSDGINTVSLILKNQGEKKKALGWLLVDAIAPVLGAASTFLFSLPQQGIAVLLALFCGFFLYIGASDLVPESHHAHPRFLTTAMTVLGVLTLFLVIRLAGV
jgi:ZIP family zinc transporter